MKEQFYQYLVAQGKKEYTASGRRSTVYSYCNRINRICEMENMSWEQLAGSIQNVIPKYDIGGIYEKYGLSSRKTPINALKAYAEFIAQR